MTCLATINKLRPGPSSAPLSPFLILILYTFVYA